MAENSSSKQAQELVRQIEEQALAERPAFEIETRGDAMKMARFLATSELIPKPLQGKPADVMVVMMGARDLGISDFRALQSVNVIQGRLTLTAELMRGLVSASPQCEYLRLVESSDKQATFETKRKGHPEPSSYTYTLGDASKAGLINKDNWKKHTKEMLVARASAGICRLVYSDVLSGLVYTPDEIKEGVVMDALEVIDVKVDPAASKEDKIASTLAVTMDEPEEAEEVEAEPEPEEDEAEEVPEEEMPEPTAAAEPVAEASSEEEKPEPGEDKLIGPKAVKRVMTAAKAKFGGEATERVERYIKQKYGVTLLAALPAEQELEILSWIKNA